MTAKINYHLAFLIHKYPYQNAWIATLWLRQYGIINAIIPKRTVQYNGQPFSLLQVYGRISLTGGLSRFYKLEQLTMFYIPLPLLYPCLELNKIIYDNLKGTVETCLFDAYHDLLAQLQHDTLDQLFYKFKMQILDNLGYGIQNEVDADNRPILTHAYYRIRPFQPFKRYETGIAGDTIQKMRCYEHISADELTILHAIVNSFMAHDHKKLNP